MFVVAMISLHWWHLAMLNPKKVTLLLQTASSSKHDLQLENIQFSYVFLMLPFFYLLQLSVYLLSFFE